MADVIVRNFKISIRYDPNTSLLNGYYTYRGQLCVIDYAGVKHYERGYVGALGIVFEMGYPDR
jgi:hypothetical protein